MSSFDRGRTTALAAFALLAAAGVLPGCTSGPLYGSNQIAPDGSAVSGLAALRGKIAVVAADDRTSQIFRNEVLFRLNGGVPVTNPIYELRYVGTGTESTVSIEAGSGIPSASLYKITVTYQLVRLSNRTVVDKGTRFSIVPFDRTAQLFAAERAILDARQQAGEEVAAKIELAVAAALRKAGV
ncbi:hypothetical protein [Mangrovicella endophytica]|uniref:hypothetical protein n=1 Tax=Mangrovicella endophytica TaxID=2066697 RepID=UPI000C9E3C7B|nr:hypothetical protein [Mangrovicella endophytica]